MALPSPAPNTVSSNHVRTLPLLGHYGELIENSRHNVVENALNALPQTAEVKTVTLTTAFSDGLVRTFSLLGYTVTITDAVADATLTGVATRLAALINADPNLRGQVSATAAAAVVTLTALLPGEALALVAGSNTSIATVTSAAEAEEIPAARFVLFRGYSTAERGAASLDKLCKLADDADLAAQSDTLQITAFDATSSVAIEIRDADGHQIYSATIAHNTSVNQTAADIEAALDADLVLVSKGITASVATDTVTIVAGTAGQEFTLEVWTVGGTGTHATTSTKALATSVPMSALGVARRTYSAQSRTIGDSTDNAYEAGATVEIVRKGKVFVQIDTSETLPTYGADVYVDLNAGAGAGRFYTTAASGRLLVSGLKWLGADSAAEVGLLDVNLAA